MSSPSTSKLAVAFARHANLTFGGGSATIAVLHTQIVERRGWIGQSYFNLAYALSRLTPGTNLLAFCAALGWQVRGFSGALVSLIAASAPCSVLAFLVTAFYQSWSREPLVAVALRGAVAAAVAVVIATGWTLLRPHWRSLSWIKAALMVGAPLALGVWGVSPLAILVLAFGAGWFWPAGETR
jgi:chromate transporter